MPYIELTFIIFSSFEPGVFVRAIESSYGTITSNVNSFNHSGLAVIPSLPIFKKSKLSTNRMVKCSICKNQIKELFLEKLKGTIVKKANSSKKYEICFECQKKFKSKERIIKEIS